MDNVQKYMRAVYTSHFKIATSGSVAQSVERRANNKT
jgi:hypothetical protein